MTTNKAHAAHEQVRKAQEYELVETEGDLFDESYRLRVCDLHALLHGPRAARREAREALGRGLREIGFVVLVGHGLDPRLFERTHAGVCRLFEETPDEVKRRFRRHERSGSILLGYFPPGESTRLHRDRVEAWEIDHQALDLEGTPESARRARAWWPAASFEPVFRAQYLACRALALPLMRAVLEHFGCDPRLYDARLTPPRAALRLNYYAALPPDTPAAGQARLVGHEDITLLSILPASPVEGLQAFDAPRGVWIRVAAPPGSLILNAGDYLQRITEDELISCTHRVSLPRERAAWASPRTSFPLLVYLHEHDLLEPLPCFATPRYTPVRALDFHTRVTRKFYGA